ncbi:MAG: M20 family metallopeptidase [Polyangiaceae bacterium]|nr:M20 family metallopeptidase [Polyangiaceae bacterium]
MSLLDAALERARALDPDARQRLRQWVQQSSYTEDVAGVDRMGELLRDSFVLPGLEPRVVPGREVGQHLVWSTPAWAERGRGVLLVGHHDTVFPPGSFEGYTEEGNIARGPGVLDMKGGIVTVRTALAALADVGALASLPLAFVSVADEEIGSPDSAPLMRELAARAREALVFEAGRAGDAIITRRKGTGGMRVRATGRAAHAGNQHADGINAIWALARFVERAQSLTQYERGITVNVGTIQGGTSKNTVPESAECALDFRFEQPEDGPLVVAAIEEAARAASESTGASVAATGGVRRPPLARSSESAALAERYGRCAALAGLGHGEAGLLGGGSDANNVAAAGVPAIDGLGPRGRGFHTSGEFIELDSLALRSDALVRFLWQELAEG